MSDQELQRSRGSEKEKEEVLHKLGDPIFSIQSMANRFLTLKDHSILPHPLTWLTVTLYQGGIPPQGITRFAEEYGAENYLYMFLKLNYEYLTSPTRMTWDVYERDRNFQFGEIKKDIIQTFKAEKEREPNVTISSLVRSCQQYNDAFYIGSDIIVYSDGNDIHRFLLILFIMVEKGDRINYFHAFKKPPDEMKRILQMINRLIRYVGFARISLDHLMICPLCARAMGKAEIFKHSCSISDDLKQMRGHRQ